MRKEKFLAYMAAAVMAFGISSGAYAKSICLDAGHGGSDPGACGCSMEEAANTLDSVFRLKKLMENAGWTVYLTRNSDTYVSLAARSSYANSKGVTTFVSIHNNAYNGLATGIETLCQTNYLGKQAGTQAKKIQNRMTKVWDLNDRGAKEQNLHVTRETNMTATLSELAFIDNCSKDAPYLKSGSHVQNAMRAHCQAVTELFDGSASSKCDGDGGGTTPQNPTGTLKAGTFAGSVNQSNWLGGVNYSVGGQTQTSAATYTMMSFTLPAGKYTATASKDGYETTSRSDCEPVAAGGTTWCSIALAKKQEAPKKGRASGFVKDGANGSKIAASVTNNAGGAVNYDGKTDWSFELDAGTYQISASASGYENGSVNCQVTSGNTSSCPITLNPKKGTITGQVFDADTNELMKATVTLGSQHIAYNGEGNWSFTVDAGTYTIEAAATDYESNSVSCAVEKGGTKECSIKLKHAAATPEPSNKKGFLKGTLQDAKSEKFIPGDVTLPNGQVYHYSGSGKYQFYLAPGSYEVTGTSDGYFSTTATCTVVSGQSVDCPIKLEPGASHVTGIVYLGTDKSHLVAADITVEGLDKSVKYDGINEWKLDISPGKYAFHAVAGNYKGTSICTVETGKTNVCNIAVVEDGVDTGKLTGIVHDVRSEFLYLEARVSVEGYDSVDFDAQSKWEIDGLPVGQHQVTASRDGYYSNTVMCNVIAGEPSYCVIPLTAMAEPGSAISIDSREPRVSVISSDDCSSMPLSGSRPVPFGLLAAFGLLSICILRRKNGDKS